MVSYWNERSVRERRRLLEVAAAREASSLPPKDFRLAAEARVAEARRRREAERPVARPFSATTGLQFGSQGEMDAAVRGAAGLAGGVAEEALFGPERRSVVGGDAPRLERFVRDWGLSEQEFRTAGERAGEGRVGAAAGWGLLGLAGAVPFVGQAGRGLVKGVTGVARAAEAVSDAGRAAGAAADVARAADVVPSPMVFADNIADDFVKERFQGTELFSYKKPNIESVPFGREDVAELAYRQGFEAPPKIVDSQTFDSLPARKADVLRERLPLQHPKAPDEVIIYRGFEGEKARSDNFSVLKTSEDYANELMNGEYYVGYGLRGHGTYFSANPVEAIQYTGYNSAQYLAREGGNVQDYLGSVVRARVAPEARLLDGFSEATSKAFEQSRFKDISEFAAANGYDGIRYSFNPDQPSLDNIVILNRSALIFDKKIARINAEAAIGFSENWRNVERFADSMFSDLPFVIERADIPTYDLPGGTGL